MFGMLDYRAHKLFRLLWLPFAIVAKASLFVVIALAIMIAQSTSYGTLVKIIIAYAAFEVMATLNARVIWGLVSWAFRRTFFWLIDVVPAHGAKPEEAQAIAVGGRFIELGLKMEHDIADWTPEDTYEFVSLMNWRARLFFGGKIRIRTQRTIRELQRIYEQTGQQPKELGIDGIAKVRKQVPGGKISWIEYAIVSQHSVNSIVAIILMVLVIGYLAP
jgi:hypothetical protein